MTWKRYTFPRQGDYDPIPGALSLHETKKRPNVHATGFPHINDTCIQYTVYYSLLQNTPTHPPFHPSLSLPTPINPEQQ